MRAEGDAFKRPNASSEYGRLVRGYEPTDRGIRQERPPMGREAKADSRRPGLTSSSGNCFGYA
jgi:hypothetical protein